jgi:hypothetical protein
MLGIIENRASIRSGVDEKGSEILFPTNFRENFKR